MRLLYIPTYLPCLMVPKFNGSSSLAVILAMKYRTKLLHDSLFTISRFSFYQPHAVVLGQTSWDNAQVVS